MFPRIKLDGEARERGRQYGSAAGNLIALSIAGYERAFRHYAGWTWNQAREEARRFADPILEYGSAYLAEIEGIAEGADLSPGDVLALNVRTEVMYGATARAAEKARLPAECSSLAVTPARGAGHTLLAENWDWLPHAGETTVLLEVCQPDRPNYVTCVEAGLLAKFGMNSSGIAVAANALVTANDLGRAGVPFHVLLRALMDCETLSDALVALMRSRRASSANYLLADRDGLALDVEAAPGDYSQCFLIQPEGGIIAHTNHFISPAFDGRDLSVLAMPDSPLRLQRLRQEIVAHGEEPLTVELVQRALSDHASYPVSICCHPDPRQAEPERSLTLASVVMDPGEQRMWLAPGNPCETEYDELDHSGLFDKPSRIRPSVFDPVP